MTSFANLSAKQNQVKKVQQPNLPRRNNPRNRRRGGGRNGIPNRNILRNNNNNNRRNNRNNNANNSSVNVSVKSLISENMAAFANAVVHPFSNGAVGALVPDKYSMETQPGCDRLTLTIDPASFNIGAGIDGGAIIAVVAMFLPRCMDAGWLTGPTINDATGTSFIQTQVLDVPATYIDYDGTVLSSLASSGIPITQNDPYVLLICAIDEVGRAWRIGTHGSNKVAPGVMMHSFSRVNGLRNQSKSTRLVGAGIKFFSNANMFDTGGTVFGGWYSQGEMFNKLKASVYIDEITTPTGLMRGIIKEFRYRKQFGAKLGCTVRYSPFQDNRLLDYHATYLHLGPRFNADEASPLVSVKDDKLVWSSPHFLLTKKQVDYFNTVGPTSNKSHVYCADKDLRNFIRQKNLVKNKVKNSIMKKKLLAFDKMDDNDCKSDSSFEMTTRKKHISKKEGSKNKKNLETNVQGVDTLVYVDLLGGIDNSYYDMMDAEDDCPTMMWIFDGTDKLFDINIDCVAHTQNRPKGNSPFLLHSAEHDPALDSMIDAMSNVDIAPVVSKGNSFSGFLNKIGRITGIVSKYASHANKIAKLFEKL